MSLSINNPFVESCRDSKSKQPECLQVFVHPASVYAGLQNEPAGIEELLPWSTFVQDKCSGIIDDSLELPENRGNLPI